MGSAADRTRQGDSSVGGIHLVARCSYAAPGIQLCQCMGPPNTLPHPPSFLPPTCHTLHEHRSAEKEDHSSTPKVQAQRRTATSLILLGSFLLPRRCSAPPVHRGCSRPGGIHLRWAGKPRNHSLQLIRPRLLVPPACHPTPNSDVVPLRLSRGHKFLRAAVQLRNTPSHTYPLRRPTRFIHSRPTLPHASCCPV